MSQAEGPGGLAQAVVRRGRLNLIWLVPIIAAGISVYLAVRFLADRGPLITITFNTADGITAQQTEVKHRAVSLGMVEDVHLSKDMHHVVVHVRMKEEGAAILTDQARFWVVRPRLAPGSISGLETLVSGAYIEVDPGASTGSTTARDFVGLEDPPGVRSDQPGRTYVLRAGRLGSVAPGTPVFYRDVVAGEVLSYDLGDGLGPVLIHVFVKAPFDKFVHDATHFWNASGISVGVGAQGLHVELQSVQALLAGGVAFETPRSMASAAPSDAEHEFRLYDSEKAADAAGFAENIPFVTYFDSSVAGLATGSAVEVFGLQIGTVTDVRLVMNPTTAQLRARVAFNLQPERLFSADEIRRQPDPEQVTTMLVRNGVRAVLESSNFITGQKDISLQYVPNAPPATLGHEGGALLMPSQGGGLDNITASISDIATKLNKIPFEDIGKSLASTLHTVDKTVSGPDMRTALQKLSETLTSVAQLARHADAGLAPALQRLPQLSQDLQQATARANALLGEGGYGAQSDFQHSMARLLDQVNEAARSIRLLADFLDRHPEALVRGRAGEAGEK